MDAPFRELGIHRVKNMDRPLRVWAWGQDNARPGPGDPGKRPGRPSIAVLPFADMSGDTEQEYFADGITEDIITDLSQVSGLFVVARNSSFTYKGKPTRCSRSARIWASATSSKAASARP